MDIKTGRYETYRGKKRWSVSHPVYGRAVVAAPDADSAIIAAAKAFGAVWTQVSFYSQCVVEKT